MTTAWQTVKQWLGLQPSPALTAAHNLYTALVARAREPYWYAQLGVPDTLDGRFEMLLVQLSMVQQQLASMAQPHNPAWELQRALSELFFRDMDRNLREMGVADTGVGRRIKAMAEAYFGRMQAYQAVLDDAPALQQALAKNVYNNAPESAEHCAQLAVRVQAHYHAVRACDVGMLSAGNLHVTVPATQAA